MARQTSPSLEAVENLSCHGFLQWRERLFRLRNADQSQRDQILFSAMLELQLPAFPSKWQLDFLRRFLSEILPHSHLQSFL
jgi:hypothetical protein